MTHKPTKVLLAETTIALILLVLFTVLVTRVVCMDDKDKATKTENAARVNELLATIYAAGGTVTATDVATLQAALKAGVTIPGTTMSLSLSQHVTLTDASYTFTAGTPPRIGVAPGNGAP